MDAVSVAKDVRLRCGRHIQVSRPVVDLIGSTAPGLSAMCARICARHRLGAAVTRLLSERALNDTISSAARGYVEKDCSYANSAEHFQHACERAFAVAAP